MQTILTIATIAAAAIYLAWHFWATAKRKKQVGCEKCGKITSQ